MTDFLWTARVYYEDTDSGGVVYYANYLKYMERARTEWLRSFGIVQRELLREHGVLFAVRSAHVDYLAPAKLDDVLAVSVRVERRGKASITLHQDVKKEREESVLCCARVKIASLDARSFKPCPIPKAVLEQIGPH
ncbi:MAG: tol-pal system-associated acyl-CoA thioesterase [Pseudomonadota bacterium]|nr:MAG: tol-pal system-associated acyl-CoA thioesterase [Pseudomonadota bacterium]